MKKLFAVVGAYVAGIAIAAKLRKDKGKSKLADGKDMTVGNVVDEVIDIHREAYEGIKNFVTPLFEDVKSFDDLKKKVSETMEDLNLKFEQSLVKLKKDGKAKKEVALEMLEEMKSKAEVLLKNAKKKAETFKESAGDTVEKWATDIEKKFSDTYANLKAKAEKVSDKADKAADEAIDKAEKAAEKAIDKAEDAIDKAKK